MAERVLSTRELNRALLARQLLLERSRLPLSRALEQVAGLQSQYAPSAYVALWTRLRDFRREALTRALEQRRAVQATLMRVTIHIVSAPDYACSPRASGAGRKAWWRRVQRQQLEGLDMEVVAAPLREHLASGPRRQADLTSHRPSPPRGFRGPRGLGRGFCSTWSASHPRAPGSGDAPTCTAWPRTGSAPRAPPGPRGWSTLVRRCLGGFGPASLRDVASWAVSR